MYNDETGDLMHPLLVEREEKNVLVIVIAGDKGFAGAFNSNITKAAHKFIDERRAQGQNIDIEPIGRKALDLVGKKYPTAVYEKTEEHYDNDLATHYEVIRHRAAPIEVTGDHPDAASQGRHRRGQRHRPLHHRALHPRRDRLRLPRLQRVQIRHRPARRRRKAAAHPQARLTRDHRCRGDERRAEGSRSARRQRAAGISLLEPEESVIESEAKKFGTAEVDYIFDQDPARLFRHLMPRYITTQIFHALLESVAAEHAARMTAMDAATNNAGDMIDALSLTMNRVRQAAITKEIIEIVSGAAAL